MAMALHGKNTHYAWHEIMPRHWFSEAKKVDFPKAEMQAIINQTVSNIESVIKNVSARLPDKFPDEIASPIFNGIRKVTNKINS